MGKKQSGALSNASLPLTRGARRARLMTSVSGYAFISPWLIGFLAFSVIPILFSLYYSFTQYDILASPVFNGLANFKRMSSDTLFWQSLKVTFFYAFVSVPLRLVFAFFVAMLFNRGTRAIRFYQMIYYLPSIVGGSIAIAVMWRRLFMADGAINAFLNAIGIPASTSWIGNPDTAIWTLIILAVWQFGSSMLIFLAGLRQVPKDYYEAAEIDGAGRVKRFVHITLPQMTPVIFFNLIMQLINGFTVFTQAFVVSGGMGDPLNSTLVYALYLYQRAFKYYEMGYSSAMAWILVLIIGVMTAIIFKTSDNWVFYETKEGK
ncbi:carbohydrate ABC transporter permease [Parasphaerochaeta coccoides]|uniref:Carbohydrate ABC transporter membrane protein 1, CUT1 family n=1 Tax=Parasphaerochaeta coccoides (strain ATCC BAA-1237 / DSM 17374 / SPN1) TaxID=760011 RepID=F4GHX9_PARC1|nr:sugar ABC transporter permease [Parasphaerochaeta coccoides]AEC02092.1 carbohydrate ABC transporter membrane protein 1, CUT1 family [Parasphaerochaeta coccoides DSM 17374]